MWHILIRTQKKHNFALLWILGKKDDNTSTNLVGYSLPVSSCFTLEFVIKNATESSEPSSPVSTLTFSALEERQSIFNAHPVVAIVETYWSIIPHGIPAKSCSAFWQANALDTFDFTMLPVRASKNVYVAPSSAAELEIPPPNGKDVTIAASKLGIFSWKLAMTPRT